MIEDIKKLLAAFDAEDVFSFDIVIRSKKGLGKLQSRGESARDVFADLKKVVEQFVRIEDKE